MSNITYIHAIRNSCTYLASIFDVCTRKIINFKYGKNIDKSLVISTLQNAYNNRSCPKNIIIHSDRGSQYALLDYIKVANQLGINLSYSKKCCPFDNASMNSFHTSPKNEKVYFQHNNNFEEANLRQFNYIEGFYNINRIHSDINYMTSIEIENKLLSC